ncbi:hypothetical protein ACFX10_027922 [Malus domestica]
MRTSASSPTLTDLRSHLRASLVTARWSELMAVSRAEKARSETPWEWHSKVWAAEMVGVEESSGKEMK